MGIDFQIQDSFRSSEVQQQMFESAKGTPKEGLVAPPGQSDHEKGLAIDLAQTDEMKDQRVF